MECYKVSSTTMYVILRTWVVVVFSTRKSRGKHRPTRVQDPESWPPNIVAKPSFQNKVEAKPVKTLVNAAVVQQSEINDVLTKFKLQKAIRIYSWIYRLINNFLRSRGPARTENLCPQPRRIVNEHCSSNMPKKITLLKKTVWH